MFKFVNRGSELKLIDEAIKKGRLIIVYGRRRIGKTRLLLEFIRRYHGKVLYHLCIDEPVELTLKRISRKLYQLFNDETLLYRPISSFDEFLNYIGDKDLVIVFDEFPVLVKRYPRIVGLLQEYIDLSGNTGTPIILCGSYVSMMEDLVSYASPLYGRRSYTLKVGPLAFHYLREFFPGKDWIELAYIYSVTDGIPEYILWFDEKLSFKENLLKNVLRKGCYFYEEAEQLLRYELRDLAVYNAILQALAAGYRRLGEICSKTGIDRSKVNKYLMVLKELDIIDYIQPIHLSNKNKLKAKNRLYFIKDNYFNFYYKYIFPNKDLLEQELVDKVLEYVLRDYDNYMGFVFEKIAKQLLIELSKRGVLQSSFYRIGKYWSKDVEIDLVTIDREKHVTVYEVKWKKLSRRDVSRIIAGLKKKIEKTPWARDYKVNYGVIAREYIEPMDEFIEKGNIILELKDYSKVGWKTSYINNFWKK